MRMDPTTGVTAADLVNGLPEEALAALFRENGEGGLRAHRPGGREDRPLTWALAEVVASAVPSSG